MAAGPSESPVGYASLIRGNVDFRWLWFGQIVSLIGDWFNVVASVALVASLTDTGLAVGGLFALRMLAPFCTSPLAGVVADRYGRRMILIVADVARGLFVLGMLLVRSAESVWLLYTLTALQLGTSSFFFTARNAILPDIVERRSLGTANAIGSITWSVMLAVGAALGGLAAGGLGIQAAFVMDALTFFVSAALVARIRPRPGRSDGRHLTLATALSEYGDGLRYLNRHPDVLAIALHKTALTILLGTTFRVVQAIVAKQVFPLGREGSLAMGLMFAAAGVGTAIGPLGARCLTGDDPPRLRWAMLAGYLLGGLGLIVSAPLWSLPAMLVGSLLAGAGNGILWVFSTQLLLQQVDATLRGRVFGTEFAMFALASAAGSASVGAAIDTRLGLTGVMAFMAAATLLPATAWALWLLSRRTVDVSRSDH